MSNQVRVFHQIDVLANKVVGDIWFLDGINFHEGQPLKERGFKWVSGVDGGCWMSPSKDELEPIISMGIKVMRWENGDLYQEFLADGDTYILETIKLMGKRWIGGHTGQVYCIDEAGRKGDLIFSGDEIFYDEGECERETKEEFRTLLENNDL